MVGDLLIGGGQFHIIAIALLQDFIVSAGNTQHGVFKLHTFNLVEQFSLKRFYCGEPCGQIHIFTLVGALLTLLIQLCDTSERVQQFISMMQGISITEVARTGTVALQKCKENDDK